MLNLKISSRSQSIARRDPQEMKLPDEMAW